MPDPNFGCDILAEGNPALVDIVFVHGLNGDRRESWTKAVNRDRALPLSGRFRKGGGVKESIYWPKDLLPQDLPAARIIAYGYRGEIARLFRPSPNYTLFSIGQDLVTRLQSLRQTHKEETRPLIFIGHSLGGLVIKDALQYSHDQCKVQQHLYSIYSAAYGVIFFGTPHRGSRIVPLANIVANLVKIGSHNVNMNLLNSVKQGSETLERLNDSFSRMLHPSTKSIKIYSFREGLPMSVLACVGKAVSDESAIMGHATEGKGYINANHTEMCRFGDRSNPDYLLVLDVIKRFARQARPCVIRPSLDVDVIDDFHVSRSKDSESRTPTSTNNESERTQHRVQIKVNAMESMGRIEHIDESMPISPDLGFFPNACFTGRESELECIDKLLRESRSRGQGNLTLYGLGGIGKTQIAIEYSRRHASDFSRIFWINGGSYSAVLLSYRNIVDQVFSTMMDIRYTSSDPSHDELLLGLRGCDQTRSCDNIASLKACCEAVKNWLARPSNKDWLLIFDNVDDLEAFEQMSLMPTVQHGYVITTSRRRQTIRFGASLEICPMSEADAISLLGRYSNSISLDRNGDMATASLIANDLGYLPLALGQAGAFIATTRISFEDYRHLIISESRRFRSENSENGFWANGARGSTTWNVSLNRVRKENEASWQLLVLCSYLAHEEISFNLLRLCCTKAWDGQYEFLPSPRVRMVSTEKSSGIQLLRMLKSSILPHYRWKKMESRSLRPATSENATSHTPVPLEWLRQLTSDEVDFRAALGVLFDYSMVKRSEDQEGLSIHPLVHWWCRQRLGPGERLLKSVEAVLLVSQAMTFLKEKPQDRPLKMKVDIHIESCMNSLELLKSEPALESEYSLCESMIRLSGVVGERQKSEKLFRESLRRIERYPECLNALKHPAVHGLAKVLEVGGRKTEAEKLYSDLLEDERLQFGEDDSRSMSTLHCLATIYAQNGKATEAKHMLERVLHHREVNEGKLSIRTLCTLNNLAFLYLQQGQFPMARRLLMAALDTTKETPELAALSMALSVNTAHMHEQCGQMETAHACLRSAVDEATARLGRYHSLTIGVTDSCSALAVRRGMRNEAIGLQHNIFEAQKATIGELHESTRETLQHIAQLCWQQGDTTRAEVYFTQLLRIQEKHLGEEDPMTLETRNSLALIHWDCGYLEAAIKQFRRVLQTRKNFPEKNDSSILLLENNLGVALKDAGDFVESAGILESCAERAKSTCGNDSVEYLVLLDSLGRLYQAQQRLDESRSMFQQSLAGKETTLGPRHPLTLSTLHNLGMLSVEQGELVEAQRLFREALSGKRITFGVESPYTLKTAFHVRVSHIGIGGNDHRSEHDNSATGAEGAIAANVEEPGGADRGKAGR